MINTFNICMLLVLGFATAHAGLILPWLTGIAPVLTPVSSLGLGLIMILAAVTVHLKRKKYKELGMNVTILILTLFVAFRRF